MTRKVYLHNTVREEAQRIFFSRARDVFNPEKRSEYIDVKCSADRITASPVSASISSPHYFASAMDGVAVKSGDTYGASETSPLRLRLGENAFPVDTGQTIPGECNAVIMIEHVYPLQGNEIEIRSGAVPWQHVRSVGEDILVTEFILPVFHLIRPPDIGVMLSAGVEKVEVVRIPRVVIIPTGTELVPPGEPAGPGTIIESNSSMFAGLLKEWGAGAVVYPIVKDDPGRLKEALDKALSEGDLILISAGSSAGSKDFTASVVGNLGEVLVHGVAVRPGKPVILGMVTDKPVVGVPGYPVSAFVALDLFVKPLLYKWLRQSLPSRPKVQAFVSRRVVSSLREEEFVRVRLGKVNDRVFAMPLERGAGILTSVVKADGWIRIPRQEEGIESGRKVEVEMLRGPYDIEGTIVCMGSHDLSLDILDNRIRRAHPGFSLASTHVGSMGGIMAVKRKEAHIAPVHLLDPATGDYNVPYIKKYLDGEDLVLMHLLYREQGLMVKPGNPCGIKGLEDLVETGIRFINRQKGAGTRIFLDYQLGKKGIEPAQIEGYEREEYNHLAVAAAVSSGAADAGLGIAAAARAFDLAFIPLARESYQLLVPRTFLSGEQAGKLMEAIRSQSFKLEVEKLGGYDLSHTGQIVWSYS